MRWRYEALKDRLRLLRPRRLMNFVAILLFSGAALLVVAGDARWALTGTICLGLRLRIPDVKLPTCGVQEQGTHLICTRRAGHGGRHAATGIPGDDGLRPVYAAVWGAQS